MENFYRDCLLDFDAEILQDVEQKFAQYYPSIVGQNQPAQLSGEGGDALIDWIAAMLCRTRAIICLSQNIAHQEDAFLGSFLPLIMNTIRSNWFIEFRDIMRRANFRWKMKIFPKECHVVLTDNPVCQTCGIRQGGQVTIVPLSKQHVLIGGLMEDVEEARSWTIEQVNAFLAAWAEKSIFAADRSDLEIVKADLEGEGNIGPRKPFLGLSERIYSKQPPPSEDLSDWWEKVKTEFGPPLS